MDSCSASFSNPYLLFYKTLILLEFFPLRFGFLLNLFLAGSNQLFLVFRKLFGRIHRTGFQRDLILVVNRSYVSDLGFNGLFVYAEAARSRDDGAVIKRDRSLPCICSLAWFKKGVELIAEYPVAVWRITRILYRFDIFVIYLMPSSRSATCRLRLPLFRRGSSNNK